MHYGSARQLTLLRRIVVVRRARQTSRLAVFATSFSIYPVDPLLKNLKGNVGKMRVRTVHLSNPRNTVLFIAHNKIHLKLMEVLTDSEFLSPYIFRDKVK